MSKRLRMAIIGCGGISRYHADALQALDRVDLVATCDVVEAKARRLAEDKGVPAWTGSVRELLDEVRPDAVSICTQHKAHLDPLLECAAAGVHAIVEKPLSTSVEEARRMVAAADEAGIVFSAFFQRRFFPAALRMKQAIEEGRLGRLTTAEVVAHMSRDRAYFDRDDWRGTWAGEGGGALMNQAIHLVDLLLWFMGRPVEVYGRWATLHHGEYIDVEDTAVATIEFENGALATIQASTGIDPEFGFRVAVHGTSGDTVSLLENPELTQAITDVWTFDGEEEQRLAWEREEAGHFGFPEFHRVQLADFVDAVLDGRPPLVTGAEGVTPVEVIQAIYESQRTRRPVALGERALA